MNAEPPDPGHAAHGTEKQNRTKSEPRWYALLFGPPFKIIGFFYRNYQSNRKRLAEISSGTGVSTLIKSALVLTLFLWIAIWLFASEEYRNRLTDTVKQQFQSLGTTLSK